MNYFIFQARHLEDGVQMPLTPLQQQIVRAAFPKAAYPEDLKWSGGGLLAQIALLTGTTHAELERWDAVANGDGPLTLDRLQESGNAFAGWPLDALEALDRVWRAGQGSAGLESVLERFSEPHTTPTQGDGPVPPPYDGPERRGSLTVAVDLKSILLGLGMLGPLVAVITMVLQVRQDVRGNSVRATVLETRVQALESRMLEQERAKTIFCAGRRAAMSRDRSDSAVAIRIPDAGC